MIHASIRRKLRHLYLQAWNREWPHDDAFLTELWREAQGPQPKRGKNAAPVYTDTLIAMRENHEWESTQ